MNFTAVFPGQGSQTRGMGRSVYESSASAREIFARAEQAAGFSVAELCFEADKDTLSRTVNSQIAITTVSLAVLAALEERGFSPSSCAGFSLGEYTAMIAAGMLSLEEGLQLVCKRGELMQHAADKTDGCMAAVLGLSDSSVEEICQNTAGTVLPVNYNCDGQLVIAGARSAVDAAAEGCRQAGARRVLPLAVSGAFHTPLMAEAAAELRKFAASLTWHAPSLSIYTNITGQRLTTDDMPRHLEQHMISPVRWKQLCQTMLADGFSKHLEVGAGKTLTGFARRISKDLSCTAVESAESIAALG